MTSINYFFLCLEICVGKITKYLRDQNEARMKQKTKITLQAKQEQISKIKKIKRSVMDVVKLNWWTCLFVLPMATASLLTSSGTGSELVYRMAAISKMAYLLSNPIIYLLCFTKIRQYWNRKKNRLPKTPKRGSSKDKRAALPSSSKTLKGDNMDYFSCISCFLI